MSAARAVFLGSGSFALPALAAVKEHPSIDLLAVVSAPSRPAGRRAVVSATPVAQWANEAGLAVMTPDRLRDPESVAAVKKLEPELLLLADYGQIVPRELLDLPANGALNLHPSLLPRHRGAAPIPAAILAGDEETGVTLMLMDAGLDTGPLIARRRLTLQGTETAPELEVALARLGADLLGEQLDPWLAGDLAPTPQPAQGASLTRPLRRTDGRLDPMASATRLERQVRAYQPWPGSFIDTPLGRVIVWRVRLLDPPLTAAGISIGTLVALPATGGRSPGLALAAGDGLLELVEVQPAGGRRMSGTELLRGRPALAHGSIVDGPPAGNGE